MSNKNYNIFPNDNLHPIPREERSIKGELAADKKELNAAKTTKAASSEVAETTCLGGQLRPLPSRPSGTIGV